VSVRTRRELLKQGLFFPLVSDLKSKRTEANGIEIISEPNCLSQESGDGFRSLVAAESGRKRQNEIRSIILLCGDSTISPPHALRLRERAARGAWIVWESSPVSCIPQSFADRSEIMRAAFGIVLREPILLSPDRLRDTGMYVQYCWPCPALIRTFSTVLPLTCLETEIVAHYGGIPVAMRRRIGSGGVVFLGSMLGPNLRAEEFEAQVIGSEMLRALA
jgi:hypothetical protein